MHKTIWAGMLAALLAFTGGAWGQALPQPGGTLIVPYPAGSAFDITGRRLQAELEKSLGRNIIVENVAGASGSLGAQKLLNADPSRLSLLIASPNELALPPLTLASVRYKPADFRMLAHLSTGALALMTRPDFPGRTLQELVDHARRPGSKPLTYASTGTGSLFHIVGAEFGRRIGAPVTHVPYRGGAPIMQDLIGGQVDITFLPLIPSYIQMAKAGSIKVLGVLAPNRNAAMPDVPPVEALPALRGFHHAMWTGLFVAASADRDLAAKVANAANELVASRAFRDWVAERGNSAGNVLSLEQAAAFFDREARRFEQLALEAGLQKE